MAFWTNAGTQRRKPSDGALIKETLDTSGRRCFFWNCTDHDFFQSSQTKASYVPLERGYRVRSLS